MWHDSAAKNLVRDELAFVPPPKIVDPLTGEQLDDPDAVPDYLVGVNKLLKAWEEMTGRTALDKRGELRQAFYMDLSRKAGERVSEFCTRYRSLVADLKGEGVIVGDAELGVWLRQKIGLDPLRKQLLETALQGSEDYSVIEAEILRLFRDLHDNDPLYRRPENRPPLTIRRMFGGRSASATSSAPSTLSRMTSASSWQRPSSMKSGTSTRQVNITENPDEEAAVEEELHDEAEGQDGPSSSLEEILQTEAGVLAAELHEAELEGVDPSVLDSLESGIEQAAETLVTMREARHQLQSVRKDRGYGKSDGSTFKHSGSSQVAIEKLLENSPAMTVARTATGPVMLLVRNLVKDLERRRMMVASLCDRFELQNMKAVRLLMPRLEAMQLMWWSMRCHRMTFWLQRCC